MDLYLLLKSLHVLGVILFLGNIIVTGWWKVMADRTGDAAIVAFAQRQVIATDWVFTLGGVVMLGIAGLTNVLVHDIALDTPWILYGVILFSLSGVVWVVFLIPLQYRQNRMAAAFQPGAPIPAEYRRLSRLWLIWGSIATVLPLAAMPVMVWKAGG